VVFVEVSICYTCWTSAPCRQGHLVKI